MLYARTGEGHLTLATLATQGVDGTCPVCDEPVKGKSDGKIVQPYWTHLTDAECDTWSEGKTQWHKTWQDQVPRERQEVFKQVDGERHFADIEAEDGQIIEIQHSRISPDTIAVREKFYTQDKPMVWIFDAIEARATDRLKLLQHGDPELPETFRLFTWHRPWTSIAFSQQRIILDLGKAMLLFIGGLDGGNPRFGWGQLVTKTQVVDWINNGPPPKPADPRIPLEERRATERRRIRAEKEAERQRIQTERQQAHLEYQRKRLADQEELTTQQRIHLAEELENRQSSASSKFDQEVQETLQRRKEAVAKLRLDSEKRRLQNERARLWVDAQRAVHLDWADGSTHWNRGTQSSCIHCGQPTLLLDDAQRPAHKVCVQYAVHVGAVRDEGTIDDDA